jgi:NifU-like protein involved in Fe-S cluster formation
MREKLKEETPRLMAELGYSNKAIELYVNNVNVGELKKPDVFTTYLGPCGDFVELYLKIDKADIVKNGKFYYVGCPGSAAPVSAMIELIKGKPINEVKRLTEHDILNELGGLPKEKIDCAKLAISTLRKAIAEYEKMKGRSEI